jgi:hypothetical protein
MITNVQDRSLTIRDILDLGSLKLQEPADLTHWLDLPIDAFRGNEEGYNERGDLITETSDGFPLNRMWDEFQKTISLWNSQRDPLVNSLTYNVTQLIEGVRYPIEQEFEEASEMGVPVGIRLGPSFRMGYDFKWWDLAVRYTWQYLIDVSADELRALNNTAMGADNRLMFTRVMRSVFNNVTRVADIDGEDVNVYPFYNGDTMVPPKWKTTVHATAHQHYITSGGATVVSGDLDDLQTLLTHHGYTNGNGYRLVLMVNPAQGDVIRGFTRTGGAKFDFIPNANFGGGIFLPANGGVVGAPPTTNIPGLVTIGTYGQFSVVEEDYIPAGYMFAYATAGPNNLGNPVGIRQHEKSSLQGMRLVKGRDNDYPLVDSYYVHGLGTGIRHRGAGAVMQITAAGSYTIPADYD